MKALKISERVFLFFMKKAVIGSKNFLQPIKVEQKQEAAHKVQIYNCFAKQKRLRARITNFFGAN